MSDNSENVQKFITGKPNWNGAQLKIVEAIGDTMKKQANTTIVQANPNILKYI